MSFKPKGTFPGLGDPLSSGVPPGTVRTVAEVDHASRTLRMYVYLYGGANTVNAAETTLATVIFISDLVCIDKPFVDNCYSYNPSHDPDCN